MFIFHSTQIVIMLVYANFLPIAYIRLPQFNKQNSKVGSEGGYGPYIIIILLEVWESRQPHLSL